MTPDIGKLIDAVELRLAALEINTRQAAQVTTQQFREIGARSGDAAADFRGFSEHAANADRTLRWHATMLKRMRGQINNKANG